MRRLAMVIGLVVATILAASLPTECADNKPLKYPTIHEAAARGDLDDVKRHLRRGAAVNERGPRGVTPLHAAAPFGQTEVANFLIKNGADVNAKTEWGGYTPLDFAAEEGRTEMVKLLIKKGADIIKYGPRAIGVALKKGHTEIALLIGNSANVKAKDKDGNTLLHQVAGAGHTVIVEVLIKRGANVNAKDKYGSTPLDRAASGGHTGVVKLLIKGRADVNAKAKNGETPLWAAYGKHMYVAWTIGPHPEVMRVLLENGADVNARDYDGSTLLLVAIVRGDEEIAKLLIEKGADVNARDERGLTRGWTPLHRVLWSDATNATKLAELLIKKGADVNAKDEGGNAPLHSVVAKARGGRGSYPHLVELLIEKGADVNATNKDGKTPLDLTGWRPPEESRASLEASIPMPGVLTLEVTPSVPEIADILREHGGVLAAEPLPKPGTADLRPEHAGKYYPTGKANFEVIAPFGMTDKEGYAARGKWHCGVDIKGGVDDPVLAVADGEVVKISKAGWSEDEKDPANFAYLICHTLANGEKFIAIYGHLRRPWALKEGDQVRAGKEIGRMGPWKDQTHLHFGIYQDRKERSSGSYPPIGYGRQPNPRPSEEIIEGVKAYGNWFDPLAFIEKRMGVPGPAIPVESRDGKTPLAVEYVSKQFSLASAFGVRETLTVEVVCLSIT